MIQRGDVVTFKPEWRDAGDESVIHIAIEDEDGGRVRVEAMIGMMFNPTQIVETFMIEA